MKFSNDIFEKSNKRNFYTIQIRNSLLNDKLTLGKRCDIYTYRKFVSGKIVRFFSCIWLKAIFILNLYIERKSNIYI